MSESPRLQSPTDDAIAEDDRRTHQRVPASRLAGLSAQLQTGPEVVLKDVSRSGARFQSESRLLPGLSVALKMLTPDGVVTIRGRVVRSRLVRMDRGGMGYEAAVSFTDLLPDFGAEPAPEPAPAPPPDPTATATLSPAVSAADEPASPADAGTTGSTSTSSVFAGLSPAPESPLAPIDAHAAPPEPAGAPATPSGPSAAGATPAGARDRSIDRAPVSPRNHTLAPADAAPADDDVPMMLLVTSVTQTTAELHEMFNGNDW